MKLEPNNFDIRDVRSGDLMVVVRKTSMYMGDTFKALEVGQFLTVLEVASHVISAASSDLMDSGPVSAMWLHRV